MSFFGAISQLGRLLPGYVQGERMANEDNWKDIFNYNKDVHEMMQNAFDYASFTPQLANTFNVARAQDYAATGSFIDMIAKMLGSAGQFAGQTAVPPDLIQQMVRNQIANQQAYQQALGNIFGGGLTVGGGQQNSGAQTQPTTPPERKILP